MSDNTLLIPFWESSFSLCHTEVRVQGLLSRTCGDGLEDQPRTITVMITVNDNDVSIRAGEQKRSANSGTKPVLHAPAVSAAYH